MSALADWATHPGASPPSTSGSLCKPVLPSVMAMEKGTQGPQWGGGGRTRGGSAHTIECQGGEPTSPAATTFSTSPDTGFTLESKDSPLKP